ncbi:hypothetical protein D9M71_739010 [compost metagenome]
MAGLPPLPPWLAQATAPSPMHSPTTSTWPVTHGNALRLCSFIMAIRSFNIGWLRQWQAMGATGWTNCAFSSALA